VETHDFVIRFAGEGGQGMVTSAEALAQGAAQGGYHVLTYTTFPSQIMGGPTFAQVRISTEPIMSNGDALDVLVCFNKEAYELHNDQVREDGVVIYNSEDFEPDGGARNIGLAFSELAKSTGNARAENMIVIGAFAHLVKMPMSYLEDFVTKRFTRGRPGDDEIIRSNIQALNLGAEKIAESGFALGELADPVKPEGEQILLSGNEAIAIGAITAGLDVFVGYPISPATTILVYMERNLVGPGKFAYQASSEIESITSLLGAGYAGKKAMTSTAGPGICLMSEGIGAGWMMEIPAVIVDVQRGGPATGLPTKTEQSDLLTCLNPAHGDSRMPILAPGTVEECFYAAINAINWAERYQGPVILMSEMMLAERKQNIPKPDASKLKGETRQIYTGTNGYQRYEASEVSPMPLPGGPGAYVANASEHDPMGDTTHLPNRHIEMTERRFSKLKLLEDGTFESDNPDASIVIMPWGGSKGPGQEAYKELRSLGLDIGWRYTVQLHPLPPKLLEELQQKALVIVPELNYLGQLSSVLRSQYVRAESITQYTGLPFKVKDLIERIKNRVQAENQSNSKQKAVAD